MTSQHLQEFVPKARYLNQINTQHSTKKNILWINFSCRSNPLRNGVKMKVWGREKSLTFKWTDTKKWSPHSQLEICGVKYLIQCPVWRKRKCYFCYWDSRHCVSPHIAASTDLVIFPSSIKWPDTMWREVDIEFTTAKFHPDSRSAKLTFLPRTSVKRLGLQYALICKGHNIWLSLKRKSFMP